MTDEYTGLLDALKVKMNDSSIDARIILRTERTDDTRKMLEDLKAYGFKMKNIRVMVNTHTKGIIADTQRILIGSHNWSNAGVQFNRDASLLIHDGGIAQYYEDVFLHDWERRTKLDHEEEIAVFEDSGAEDALLDDTMVKVDWSEYLE